MSKDGSTKYPISSNQVEKFMGMVWVLADMCSIEDAPDVYHYVELLSEAVGRHQFNSSTVSPQKKVHVDRKRFIAIFKTRYEQLLDLEYTRQITPVEAKLINQLNKMLADAGFMSDDYLAWVFDDFLVENPKFRPPTIKSVCAQFFVHSFIDANKELKDARRRQELDKRAGMDLIQRARALLRGSIQDVDGEKIKLTLTGYSERRIMLSDFRKVVESIEEKYRQSGQK